jgi:hypothetical protein
VSYITRNLLDVIRRIGVGVFFGSWLALLAFIALLFYISGGC